MTLFERYPMLQSTWDFVARQDETVQIVAGSFVFVILIVLIFGRRKPVYGYEADNPLIKANNLYLKIYPICIFACWISILAGLALVGMGGAAHFGYINLGADFAFITPLELALYACAIPIGAVAGIWKLKDRKAKALAQIAAHNEASDKAGLIKSY